MPSLQRSMEVLLFGVWLYQCWIYTEAVLLGPADVTIKQIQQCQNPEYSFSFTIERKKINRTHELYSANFTFLEDLDATVAINMNIAKWGDGGYKPNAFIIEDSDACKFLFKWVEKATKDILIEIKQPPECPIKKGFYMVVDHALDKRDLPKELVYGDFRVDLIMIKNQINIFCAQILLTVKPKKIFP